MFTLENLKLSKSLVLAASIIAATNLSASNTVYEITNEKAVDGSVIYPEKNGKYTAYRVNTQKETLNGPFGFGRVATKNEIIAWDRDVMPDGTGLPKYDVDKNGKSTGVIAKGSVEWGDELYVRDCQMCHGDFGLGGTGYPPLAGAGATTASLSIQHLNPAHEHPNDENPRKTIGTNWPYASTLFWYIQSAMPFPHPKSLSNSETYAITAYMLAVNEVKLKDGTPIDDDFVLEHANFMEIDMPNVNGFYPEVDAPGGQERMKKFLSDTKNYGGGTRCMSDCHDYKMLTIQGNIDNFFPPLSTKRDLPVVEKKESVPGQEDYAASCAACHDNPALGAPVPGDKDQWAALLEERSTDQILHNAINGLNAMPPRGGTDLSDEKMKEIVDYMINSSK
jgi:cytochrome c5